MNFGSRRIALVLWALTLVIVSFTGYRAVYARLPRSPFPALPSPGDTLALGQIDSAFGVTLAGRANAESIWLLIVTSSCRFCLALDKELEELKDAAACARGRVIPLVIELDQRPDSIVSVLHKRGLEPEGMSGMSGFAALKVRRVPTVLVASAGGEIMSVLNPVAVDWLADAGCDHSNQ